MPRAPRLAALAGLLALAACDSQEPPRTNPLDPGFEGNPTATAPANLALDVATTTTATLSWTDRSSFETGVRVERAGPSGVFETIATLPPDATRFTDTGLTGTDPLSYRVVALSGRGLDSAPSTTLRIRYPADTLDLGTVNVGGLALPEIRISPNGERLYTRDGTSTRITSLRTGERLGTIPRLPEIVGFLDDGRTAFSERTTHPFIIGLRLFDGAAQQELAPLRIPETACVGVMESLTVSADGQRIASACDTDILVWNRPSDVPVRFPRLPNQGSRLTVSPDGSRIIAETSPFTTPDLLVTDAATGAVAWEARNVQEAVRGYRFGLSADGTVMAYATGGRIRVVDLATGAVRVEAATGPYSGVTAASSDAILVSGYDPALPSPASRVLRAADLSLIRTLPTGPLYRGRLVPGSFVTVESVDGRSIAVRTDFASVWEVAGPR